MTYEDKQKREWRVSDLVREKTLELNKALSQAAELGLRIEIDIYSEFGGIKYVRVDILKKL